MEKGKNDEPNGLGRHQQTAEELKSLYSKKVDDLRYNIFTQFAPFLRWSSDQTWIYTKFPTHEANTSLAKPIANREIAIITNYQKSLKKPAITIVTNEQVGHNSAKESTLFMAEKFVLYSDERCEYTCGSFEIRNRRLTEETGATVLDINQNRLLLSREESTNTPEELGRLMVQYGKLGNPVDQDYAITQAINLVGTIVASKAEIQHGTLIAKCRPILE